MASVRAAGPASPRHSCAVQLDRAERTIPEIASITGHSPVSVTTILTKKLPRDLRWLGTLKGSGKSSLRQNKGVLKLDAHLDASWTPWTGNSVTL